MSLISRSFDTILYSLHTLLLFTWTDFKTIFFPITIFAVVAAPVHSLGKFLQACLWIWVHLLECNISNQAGSKLEDAVNRPWRPIPAGRISEKNTYRMRICLTPICLSLSAFYGRDVVYASLLLAFTTLVYDEFGLSGHWIGKNACAIGGYVSFEIGATKIMASSLNMDNTASFAVLSSAAIIVSTIHAQDFPEIDGDAMLGRMTFPMSYPEFSRSFTLGVLMLWSLVLSYVWRLGTLSSIVLNLMGMFVGARYYRLRKQEEDSMSYKIYNIWLILVHVLPAQRRWLAFNI